jgi:hypothetical protein
MYHSVKKFTLPALFIFMTLLSQAQDSTSATRNRGDRKDRRMEKRQRINSMIKQEEEGVLAYDRQNVFGVQLRTNGYGAFYEIGRAKSPRKTNLYLIELTEIKDAKEDRVQNQNLPFSNSLVYAKINNFYQLRLGFGQQYIFGQKGNKNGVAVMGIYGGGLSLGLVKPYYLELTDDNRRYIKFTPADSAQYIDLVDVRGGAGFTKGWNDLTFNPGVMVKAGLRFDFGRYNEMIQALEIGISADFFAKKTQTVLFSDPKQLFYQGHIAFLFGRRK